jgi:hypothetical protein
MVLWLGTGPPAGVTSETLPDAAYRDYGELLRWIQIEDLQAPRVAFNPSTSGVDVDLHRENRAYLNHNGELIETIRQTLAAQSLEWRLTKASKQLVVVPEARAAYANLFESYCRDAVAYVLARTGLPNPYAAIVTLTESTAPPVSAPAGGITAYLVHNIADEYTEWYEFFDAGNEAQRVRLKLNNLAFSGVIGSYSSFMAVDADHQLRFQQSPYTLWRNSARDPLNVFIAPVEETLHIALRGATERAVQKAAARRPLSSEELIALADEWLAVEEAVVGGMVRRLMPELLARHFHTIGAATLDATLAARSAMEKYRWVTRGIAAVEALGLRETIESYRRDPQYVKRLLESPAATDVAAEPRPAPTAPAGRPKTG